MAYLITLYAEITVPSENFMYKPRSAGRYAYLYKDPQIAEYQSKVREIFRKQVSFDHLPPRHLVSNVVTYYLFGIKPEAYWTRDISNMIKATEDAILGKEKSESLLPYDDSRVTCDTKRKIISDIDFVVITIGLITSPEEDDLEALNEIVRRTQDELSSDYLGNYTSKEREIDE